MILEQWKFVFEYSYVNFVKKTIRCNVQLIYFLHKELKLGIKSNQINRILSYK